MECYQPSRRGPKATSGTRPASGTLAYIGAKRRSLPSRSGFVDGTGREALAANRTTTVVRTPNRRTGGTDQPGPAGDTGRLDAQLRQGNAGRDTTFRDCWRDAAPSLHRPSDTDDPHRRHGRCPGQRTGIRSTARRACGSPRRNPATTGRRGIAKPSRGCTRARGPAARLRLRHTADDSRGVRPCPSIEPTALGDGKFCAGASLSRAR